MVDTAENSIPLVMLIDDSLMDLFINKKVITSFSEGASIMEFSMASKALDYLVNHEHEEDMIPDIIFLDIYMPYMNGFEFLEGYQKLAETIRSKITLFMLSSSLDPGDIKKANEDNNVKRFFQKPLTRNAVDEITRLTTLVSKY